LLAGCPHPEARTTTTSIADAGEPTIDAASEEDVVDAGEAEPFITASDAENGLFIGAKSSCSTGDSNEGRIRCMLAHRYTADKEAMSIAVDLFRDTGDVAAVDEEQTMNGGFRGQIHIVPELPIGPYRKHLEWVAGAMRDFDDLMTKIHAKQPASMHYRLHATLFRFFRSVGRTTPSAYADGWVVAFNVSGSLLQTEQGVRETLFHELFHSNDRAHGEWSSHAFRTTFDGIVHRCGTKMGCLAPYAPSDTVVRGGTYYAFQPDNGDAVREYAAELALRWYKEQRAIAHGEKLPKKAFKCGPPENKTNWSLMVNEFFGGIDLVPPCE
jgi:hypothetical protein